MSYKRIWCRLGFHYHDITSETVTAPPSEEPYGERERIYRIKRCIHCGKTDKDEILPPRPVGLTTDQADRFALIRRRNICNPYGRRNRPR